MEVAAPFHVLIIEDSPEDRADIRQMLLRGSQRLYKFTEAVTGAAGVRALRDHPDDPPDCVLLDFHLPDMDAFEVLAAMRGGGELTAAPVVVFTGATGSGAEVIRAGAQDYVGKGWATPESLTRSIENAVERYALGRERLLTDAALRESRHFLHRITEVAPGVLHVYDFKKQSFVFVSPMVASMIGYRAEEITAMGRDGLSALIHPDDLPGFAGHLQRVLTLGDDEQADFEHRVRAKSGEWRWFQNRVSVFVRDSKGAVHQTIGAALDITERKETEQRIRRSEANLNAAQRIAHLGSWEFDLLDIGDLTQGALRWSEEVFRIWGYEPGGIEVSYENFLATVHPEDRGLISEAIAAALRENRSYDLTHRIVRPDGTQRIVRGQAEFQFEAGTSRPLRMSGTVLDVTEQHEAQRTISRALERLTDAQRIGQIGDWEMDLATQAINWSPQVFEIFGRDPGLGAPKNYEDLKPMLEPASWALQVEKVARVIETAESQDYELVGVRPDGTRVIIQARAVARKGGDGRVVGLRGTVQNITERKKLEQQFLRVQRQESVGTLAGGVAHDLNNLLAPIMLVLPMLRDKIPDAEREELLTMVDQSVKRAAKIIKQLLTFGRGIEGERRQVNVGALGREMVELMRQTFPREITVREKIPGGLWPIRADATQIHQVLMNLCVNARDAMPKGGLLTITAQNTMISGMEAGPHPPAKPGPHVCLTISDMGEGIARANIDRIFEPFFTTKAIGQGSGLGLPTVLGIVKSHGGYVTVYSELRRGTSFKVYLPATVDVAATIEREPARPPVGAGELILVVDDEATIRQALTLTLQNGRYRVVAAADGREALQLLTEAADRPQLVMTDIMMPEMSGIELIAAIRSLSPDLPVIATTGLHDQVRQEELAVLGVSQVLAKPCSVEDILAAVHRTLAAKI